MPIKIIKNLVEGTKKYIKEAYKQFQEKSALNFIESVSKRKSIISLKAVLDDFAHFSNKIDSDKFLYFQNKLKESIENINKEIKEDIILSKELINYITLIEDNPIDNQKKYLNRLNSPEANKLVKNSYNQDEIVNYIKKLKYYLKNIETWKNHQQLAFNFNELNNYLKNISKNFITFEILEDIKYKSNELIFIKYDIELLAKYCNQETIQYVTKNLEDLEKFRTSTNNKIKEKIINDSSFAKLENKELDAQQVRASINDEKYNLILSGAGSGKTTTLLGRLKYLIDYRSVKAEDIILLSFTNNTVDELKQRVKDQFGEEIYISTFHKLGKEIISRTSNRAVSIETDKEKVIEEIIKQLVEKDSSFALKSLEFISLYLYNKGSKEMSDKNIFLKGKQTLNTYNNQRISTLNEKDRKSISTLNHEKVKSIPELVIANFLFLNGIKYEYEREYKYYKKINQLNSSNDEIDSMSKNDKSILAKSISKGRSTYRPDFYLTDYNIYFEHFGMNSEEYLKQKKEKISWHKALGTKLIYTSIEDYYNEKEDFIDIISKRLKEHNVKFSPLSYKEVYEVVNYLFDGKTSYYDFLKLVVSFVEIFKVNQKDLKHLVELKEISKSHSKNKIRTRKFLDIFEVIYKQYESYLIEKERFDFNDLINDAQKFDLSTLKNKHLIIDEYQDITFNRKKLIEKIIYDNNSELFAIGDDWQSIYEFSGSELEYTINFKEYFGDFDMFKIEKTYRNIQDNVDLAKNFIEKNDYQVKKEIYSAKKAREEKSNKVILYESNITNADYLKLVTNIIDEIVSKYGESKTIGILTRNNNELKFFESNNLFKVKNSKLIYNKFENLEIKTMTIHRSKGLEFDNVILLSNKDEVYGFPNKMEDDPILHLFKPFKKEAIDYAEERRLFYVALTRTKNSNYHIAPKIGHSDFIKELLKDFANYVELRDVKDNSLACQICGNVLEEVTFSNNKILRCRNNSFCSYEIKSFHLYSVVKESCPVCKSSFLLITKSGKKICPNIYNNISIPCYYENDTIVQKQSSKN
jgi:DNA helicase-4